MLGMQSTNGAGELRRYAVPAKRIGVLTEEYARQREAGNWWCSKGKHWAPDNEFARTAIGRRQSLCNECQAKYNAERVANGSNRRAATTT